MNGVREAHGHPSGERLAGATERREAPELLVSLTYLDATHCSQPHVTTEDLPHPHGTSILTNKAYFTLPRGTR